MSSVWIEVRATNGLFEAMIVTRTGMVCGVGSGATQALAVADVSRSLARPLPVRVTA